MGRKVLQNDADYCKEIVRVEKRLPANRAKEDINHHVLRGEEVETAEHLKEGEKREGTSLF